MSAAYTEIHVNRKSEAAFRRRAIKAYPNEMMELIYGKIKGHTLHIHSFVPVKHTAGPLSKTYKTGPTWVHYDDEVLDEHEDDAAEEKKELLGSIHTHPNCLDCIFSETDTRDSQPSQETVMGICSITQDSKGRKSCQIVYWPTPRPMKTVYL